MPRQACQALGLAARSDDGVVKRRRGPLERGRKSSAASSGTKCPTRAAALDDACPAPPDEQRTVGHRALLGAPVDEHRAADPCPGLAIRGVHRTVEMEGGAELGADAGDRLGRERRA